MLGYRNYDYKHNWNANFVDGATSNHVISFIFEKQNLNTFSQINMESLIPSKVSWSRRKAFNIILDHYKFEANTLHNDNTRKFYLIRNIKKTLEIESFPWEESTTYFNFNSYRDYNFQYLYNNSLNSLHTSTINQRLNTKSIMFNYIIRKDEAYEIYLDR